MQRMNREDVMDLLRRGVRLAADNPGRTVIVEFTKLSIFVELELDERDRRDPVFLDTMAESLRSMTSSVSSRGACLVSSTSTLTAG